VVVRSEAFNQALWDKLHHLMQNSCKQVRASDLSEWSAWRLVRSFCVFHLLRWYPAWAGWLPRHVPHLKPLGKQGPRGGSTRTDVA
jgi:cardiolipin synthase